MIHKVMYLFANLLVLHYILSTDITVQVMNPADGQKTQQKISSNNLVHHYLSTFSETSLKSFYMDKKPDICTQVYNSKITLENLEEKFVLFVHDKAGCDYKTKLKNAHPNVRIMFFIVSSISEALKKYQEELDLANKDDKNQVLELYNSFGVFIEENSVLVQTIKSKLAGNGDEETSQPFDTIVAIEQGSIEPKKDVVLNLVSLPFTNDKEMNRMTINHIRSVIKVLESHELRSATTFDNLLAGLSTLAYTTISNDTANKHTVKKLTKEEFKASKEDVRKNLVTACFRSIASKESNLENGATTKPKYGYDDNEKSTESKNNLKKWKANKEKYGSLMYRYLFYLNGIYNKYIEPGSSNEVIIDEELFKTVKLGDYISKVKECVKQFEGKLEKTVDWSKDEEFLNILFVIEINDYSNKDFVVNLPLYLIESKMAEVSPYCGPSSCPLKELICFNISGVASCSFKGVNSNIDLEGKGGNFGCTGNKVPDNKGVCGGDDWGSTESQYSTPHLFNRAFLIILIVVILLILAVALIKSNERVGNTIDNMYRGIFSKRKSTFTQFIRKKSEY